MAFFGKILEKLGFGSSAAAAPQQTTAAPGSPGACKRGAGDARADGREAVVRADEGNDIISTAHGGPDVTERGVSLLVG